MALKIGDKIPEVLGFDADGNEVLSSEFLGKKLVIYFYYYIIKFYIHVM